MILVCGSVVFRAHYLKIKGEFDVISQCQQDHETGEFHDYKNWSEEF